MLRFLLSLLLLPFLATAYAGRPFCECYEKNEYRIPMRDGVRLYTAVYSPRDTASAPIVILRTPYGCRPYGPDAYPNWDEGYMHAYVERGYIIVLQDVRGRYRSEGEFVHVRPVGEGPADETTDSYDTVDWLVARIPHNNGRVGFIGSSYPGFYALMGALSRHPAVKAASPQAPVTDWFLGDDVHHNGVLMLGDATRFLASMNTPAGHTPSETAPGRSVRTEPDERTFFLRHATRAEITELLAPNAFWEEMMRHPDYDAWWRMRDTRNACRDIAPALLIVGGTFDAEDCYGAWNLYRAVKKQSPATACHLVVGPWAHGAWRGEGRRLGDFDFGEEASGAWYVERFEMPFFDRYLRSGPAEPLPGVSVFTSGDDRWHAFDEWVPGDASETTLYLDREGTLSERKPSVRRASTGYVSDPADPVPYVARSGIRRPKEYMIADQRLTEGRQDVVRFRSEPLAEDRTFVGPVDADLRVVLSTTDADFVVKLIDEFPADSDRPGYRMLVRGEVMRGRYRNSFSAPEPFVPGHPARVPVHTTDIAHTFRAGHRIVIEVQSSWFPLAERNPQQFVDLWRCSAADFIPCRVTLLHQRNNASSITLRRLNSGK